MGGHECAPSASGATVVWSGERSLLHSDGDRFDVWLNTGAGAGSLIAGPGGFLRDRPASAAVGDVDGDGDLDLLSANVSGNTVSVRLNPVSYNHRTRPTTSRGEMSVGGV
ncbi:FG-GAP-like repeat-containing protein [Deinococcus sp. ME38]|uniref:FG-GAP-like repeat-containing protein n=1 Tax=Deinococcus sp. ME38 TaxID=3400344 RepID=UPI003B594F19